MITNLPITSSSVCLVLDGVGKRYPGAGGEIRALDPLSFEVCRGEFVAVIGPSGCGKSTLFNILGGLIDDYDGSILLDGQRVRGPNPQIGMVFQEESTFPWRTVLQNVVFPLEVRGVERAERERRARATIALVGLGGFEDRRPGELSGGMRQRTALARALCAEPEILLMDEPFAALDEQTRLLLGEKLLEIWQRLRQTTLLITHSIAEAVQLSDRVIVLSYRPGRIKQIVEIDLPRPRTSEILAGERFAHLVAQIWNDLRVEAARGLAVEEATMIQRTILAVAFAAIATIGSAVAARADDTVSVSSGQKGAWDQMIVQQGIDQGFFKKEHLDIKLAYTAGGPDTIQAVATGSADMGMGIGTTAVIAAYTKGAPIRIAAASFTGQNDVFLYTKAESPIKSFADMNGKSVGYTRPGSSTYVFEHVLATQDKVQPNFVAAGDMPATLTQVMSGQIDVGWAVPPFNLDLIAQKNLKIIARGRDARELVGQTVRVDIVNANFARDHRDVDVRFWRAYRTTLDWMYKNTSASIANFARYNDIPINVAHDSFAFYPKAAVEAYPIAQFNKSVDDAITYKFITKPLDADQSKAIFDIVFEHR